MKNLVVFASGTGSNAVNITRHFMQGNQARVVGLFCNNPSAPVIDKMKQLNVPVVLFDKNTFLNESLFLNTLTHYRPDLIVLAGFLLLVPDYLIKAYSEKIINIHPSLLPKFGGKGMYGMHVHKAVIASAEKESGLTIHLVNEHFDDGEILLQVKCAVDKTDTPETLGEKVLQLEHEHYPRVIAKWVTRV